MGLDALASEPQTITSVPGLSAMMLDATRTFDELVARYAPDAATRDAILSNAYYQRIAGTLAGSREFMAMEKVFALAQSETWDLLVVDTPPAQHALDFLDAPRRLLELLDGSGLSIVLQATSVADRLSFGMLKRSREQFLKLFETFTGHRVLVDLNEFTLAFAGIFDDLRSRSRRIDALLREPQTRFVVVTAADVALLEQARALAQRLVAEDMHIAGAIVNRVYTLPAGMPMRIDAADVAGGVDAALLARIHAAADAMAARAAFDAAAVDSWADASLAVCRVPVLGAEVASLDDLEGFAAALG